MFLRTGQGHKIRTEAGKPGPNTAHAETARKARNPGPTPPTTHAGTESGQAMRPNKGRAPI